MVYASNIKLHKQTSLLKANLKFVLESSFHRRNVRFSALKKPKLKPARNLPKKNQKAKIGGPSVANSNFTF